MNFPARIAIFYDVPDWAFHNIALNIARQGGGDYVFELIGHEDWFGYPEKAAALVTNSDVVVFLWRFDIIAFLDSLDESAWRLIARSDRPAFVSMVYDHLYMGVEDLRRIGDPFRLCDIVATCSARLTDAYVAQPHLPNPSFTVPDGVDLDAFTPNNRSFIAGRPLRIGWVGNSAMGRTVEVDLKGKQTIFDPAIEVLRKRGLLFEVKIADRAGQPVAKSAMPAFYNDMDVLVCVSSSEGTPNPLLEAVASGVAVVTTDVGLVHQVLGPLQSSFIMKERSVEALVAMLETLINAPDRVAQMQAENISRRGSLGWATRWPIWDEMFKAAGRVVAQNAAQGDAKQQIFTQFRNRRPSIVQRARRIIVQNRMLFRGYDMIRSYWPGAIRLAKRAIDRTRP
jgi:glycosyltransferase involved in cell wall biosynthesis